MLSHQCKVRSLSLLHASRSKLHSDDTAFGKLLKRLRVKKLVKYATRFRYLFRELHFWNTSPAPSNASQALYSWAPWLISSTPTLPAQSLTSLPQEARCIYKALYCGAPGLSPLSRISRTSLPLGARYLHSSVLVGPLAFLLARISSFTLLPQGPIYVHLQALYWAPVEIPKLKSFVRLLVS